MTLSVVHHDLGGSILGVKFLDPLAGLVVSGMILKAGLETGYQRCNAFCHLYMLHFSYCLLCCGAVLDL